MSQLCEGYHRAIRHQSSSAKSNHSSLNKQQNKVIQWEKTMIGPRSDEIYGIFKNLRARWCTGGARVVGRTDLELWRFLLRRSIASWYRTSRSESLLATTSRNTYPSWWPRREKPEVCFLKKNRSSGWSDWFFLRSDFHSKEKEVRSAFKKWAHNRQAENCVDRSAWKQHCLRSIEKNSMGILRDALKKWYFLGIFPK